MKNAAQVIADLAKVEIENVLHDREFLEDYIEDVVYDINKLENRFKLIEMLLKISPSKVFTEIVEKIKEDLCQTTTN